MRLAINAIPLLNPRLSIYVFLMNLLRGLVESSQIGRIMLHVPTLRHYDLERLPRFDGRAEVFGQRVPAMLLERAAGRVPWFRGQRLFPGYDLYWNAHHLYHGLGDRRFPRLTTLHSCAWAMLPQLVAPEYHSVNLRRLDRARAGGALIHAVSQSVAADLCRSLGFEPQRIRISHNPIDPRFRPIEPDLDLLRERCGVRRPYLLCAGILSEIKNQLALVRAWGRIRSAVGRDLSLVLVGSPDRAAVAIEQARLAGAAPESIRIIGPLPHLDQEDAMLHLYNGAAAYVQPSHYEGCCQAVSESLACGVPVACSDIPNFRDCLGQSAVYFDQNDPADIAEKVSRLILDPAQRERVLAARGPALELHDRAACVERMLGIFEWAAQTPTD